MVTKDIKEIVNHNMSNTKTIEIGTQDTVVIDKLFGPTIFANLRITADFDRGWVIEREWISGGYIEWCVIPAQIEQEFTDHNKTDNA